jgi:hypothetical protein
MKNKNKNQGFAILEILLVVVSLGFVVAIALVVLRHEKTKPSTSPAKIDTSKYLQVKEWNVYLQLPDPTDKVSYKLVSADNPDEIIISSEALDKLSTDHPECVRANGFIHLQRSKTAPTQPEAKQLGLYHYFNSARPSVSPCIGSDIAAVQALNNQAYDLYDKMPNYKNIVINP